MSSYHGWGVYALNLLLAWAHRPTMQAALLCPLKGEHISIDPLETSTIAPALERSVRAQRALAGAKQSGEAMEGKLLRVGDMVLQALCDGLPLTSSAHGLFVSGSPDIGCAFLEKSVVSEAARQRLQGMPLVVAGSSWNAELLRSAGAHRVELLLQGVDTSHFHPAPRRELFPGRFVVFSGGKLEPRKGQDLVVSAFRIFVARHPEALLLTAWSSPWPQLALGVGLDSGLLPPTRHEDGSLDIAGWTERNGIAPYQALHLGMVPNRAMARILREADVGLFANRCEGGTNLVAMECIACGVPTIVSANSGHLDLVEPGWAIPLRKQAKLEGDELACWGVSDVEEMVEALEDVYRRRERAKAVALEAAEAIGELTWARQMGRLGDILEPYLAPA